MTTCACGAVDVHTHVVPGHFPAYLGKSVDVPWPSMAPAQACHRHVMVSGKVYRTVSEQAWSVERRVADMATLGVSAQVLSPMPELLSYWLDPADAQPLLRFLNEEIAAMVASDPTRFFGLAAVPLQDVDMAIAELDHAVNVLKLSGIEIAGNVNGDVIGAQKFDPFWAAVEAWGAAVFIHPLRPGGMDRLQGPRQLEQLLAFPSETGLALASLMTSGVLDRHPRLRIAASHGGGTLGALLPRLQHGWTTFDAVRAAMPTSPAALARRLYVDSLVYDPAALRSLIERFGDTQVLVGSDYPFAIQEPDPVGRIDELKLPAATRELLRSTNARRWLAAATQPPTAHRSP